MKMISALKGLAPALATAALALSLSGCASSLSRSGYQATVNSVAAPDALAKRTFALAPGNRGVSPTDPQFQKFAAMANRALVAQGLIPARANEAPQITVFLTYMNGAPLATATGLGRPLVVRDLGPHMPGEGYASYTSTAQAAAAGPVPNLPTTTGLSAISTRSSGATEFSHMIQLTAEDLTESKRLNRAVNPWKASALIIDNSNDLTVAMPYLIAAVAPYAGKSSGPMASVTLAENDRKVVELVAPAS